MSLIHFALDCGGEVARSLKALVVDLAALNAQDSVEIKLSSLLVYRCSLFNLLVVAVGDAALQSELRRSP